MRIPIKATAREPITQAGYISATSAIHAQLTCDQQPVHTFGSEPDIGDRLGGCLLHPDKQTSTSAVGEVRLCAITGHR